MTSVQCKQAVTAEGGLRARLLDRAMAMLDSGIGDVTLRGVARAAGVSAMAPYRHFADHAALLSAIAAAGFEDLRASLAAADAQADGAAALIVQGEAYVAFAMRRPGLFRLMFAGHAPAASAVETPDAAGLETEDLGDAYAVLADRVAVLWPAQGPAAALGCWAIVHGIATLTLETRLASASEQVRAVLAIYVAGLGPISSPA